MSTVFMVAYVRRATFSRHAEKIFVVRPADESMAIVLVCQLAGSIWVVDIGMDGHRHDIAIVQSGSHTVLAPRIRAIPRHSNVHCPVVGLLFFDVLPDFAWIVEDPELTCPLRMGRDFPDPTVSEDYVLVFVVFGVHEGHER